MGFSVKSKKNRISKGRGKKGRTIWAGGGRSRQMGKGGGGKAVATVKSILRKGGETGACDSVGGAKSGTGGPEVDRRKNLPRPKGEKD